MQKHTHAHATHTCATEHNYTAVLSSLNSRNKAASLYPVIRFIKQVKFRGNLIITEENPFTNEKQCIFYIRNLRFLMCTKWKGKNVGTFKNNISASVFYC